MSAPVRLGMRFGFQNVLKRSKTICQRCLSRLNITFTSRVVSSSIGLSIALYGTKETLCQVSDLSSLSQKSLIRNASSAVVDSSSTILSQVVASIISTEREYKQAVDGLCELLEFQMSMVGLGGPPEEQLWEDILEARNKLAAITETRQELALLYSSVEKLMNASGEVAFFAGAEYAVTCIGERVHSAETYIALAQGESRVAEENLHLLEVKVIEVTARKAEEEKRKKALLEDKKDEIQNDDTPSEE